MTKHKMPTAVGSTALAPQGGVSFNANYVVGVIALLDLAGLLAFFVVSYYQAAYSGPVPARIWRVTDAVFCAGVLYMMMASGGYSRILLSNPFSQVSRILVNGTLVACVEWAVLRLANLSDDFEWPLSGPLNVVSGGVFTMCAIRLLANRTLLYAAAKGTFVRTVAVVGAEQHGRRLLEALRRRKEPWTRIIGLYDDRKDRLPEVVDGHTINGTVDTLIGYARESRVDEVMVALPWGAQDRLLAILDKLKAIPANVRLAPDAIGHHFLDQGFARLDGIPVYNIFSKPITGWDSLFKRLEDLVLGTLILIAVTPIMLLCAIAIKLDSPGPVFFHQPRFGYNNKLIGVYKFRSMYHHLRDENANRLTSQNDSRITYVGGFLRRTSLDELPQLLNVITGEMSLVGPRPHATQAKAAGKLYQEVVREYAARHRVKPGITGWAQVNGWRGETDTEEKILRRVECDLYYMENWSLFLDIEILFRTLLVVTGKNVY